MFLVIIIIFVAVFVPIISSIIFSYKETPKEKGQLGEFDVRKKLNGNIPGEQYVINDLLFKNGDDSSCQIDHILINKYGIWVIETKNYSGMIFGNSTRQEWTQVLAYGNEKHRFQNPLKQNEGHIYHLSRILEEKVKFHNVVVFLDNADISNVFSPNVYTLHDLPHAFYVVPDSFNPETR